MKLIVNNQNLRAALKLLSTVVSANSIVSIIGTVKFTVTPDRLYLEGSDLETTIKTWLTCESDEPFTFCIDFEEINKLSNTVVDGALVISLDIGQTKEDGKFKEVYRLQIKSDLGTKKCQGVNPVDFPKLPVIKNVVSATLDTGTLLNLKIASGYCHTNKDNKTPALQGVCFNIQRDGLQIAATNGFYIFETELLAGEYPTEQKKILSVKSAKIAASLTSCHVDFSDNHFRFIADDCEIYARCIDQTYPNYKVLIPEYAGGFTINKTDLVNSVKYALLSAVDTLNIVVFSIANNTLNITSANTATAKESECAPISISNNTLSDCEFKFNGLYLLHALSHLSEDVIFYTEGAPEKPFLLGNEGVKKTTLLMPQFFAK